MTLLITRSRGYLLQHSTPCDITLEEISTKDLSSQVHKILKMYLFHC